MFDELDRLRSVKELVELLAHYAERAAPDRQAWQDRLCRIEGLESRTIARLHGELLAYGWLEQNTGFLAAERREAGASSHRVTGAGLRALKEYHAAPVAAG